MKNQLHKLFNQARRSLKFGWIYVVPVALNFIIINPTLAQNTLNNVGLTSATPSAAAYGMRKLSSAYSGFALQVRRSSDNMVLHGLTLHPSMLLEKTIKPTVTTTRINFLWQEQIIIESRQWMEMEKLVTA